MDKARRVVSIFATIGFIAALIVLLAIATSGNGSHVVAATTRSNILGGSATATTIPPTATYMATCTRTPTFTPPPFQSPTPYVPCVPGPWRPLNEGFDNGYLGHFAATTTLTPTGGWEPQVVNATCAGLNYAAVAPDPDSVSDQRLTLTDAIAVPPDLQSGTLTFYQSFAFEQNGSTYTDGGVLEFSTDNGSTWFDSGPYLQVGAYNGTITRTGETCNGITPPFSNGQSAWVGTRAPSAVTVNILPFAGDALLFRFRLGTDCTGGSTGWTIDNIVVQGIYPNPPCLATPTSIPPTSTPTITPTPTPTITPTPSITLTPGPSPTPTSCLGNPPCGSPFPTNTRTNTVTPNPTATATVTATSTPCTIEFSDVPNDHTFYTYIQCLACRGIISGYPNGTFRPGDNVTRGQIAKIVSLAAGWSDPVSGQTFEDVPAGSTFWSYVERMILHDVLSGYPCGNPEPCVSPGNKPYFRPSGNTTRGQMMKIVAKSLGVTDPIPPDQQTFQDVPPNSTFWLYTEQLIAQGNPPIIHGYACMAPAEPCIPPENRPYFRPANTVTRGQASQIVANAFYPSCSTRR